jgi:hypothetical protein
MRLEQFKLWLAATHPNLGQRARTDVVARANRVANYLGDLDAIPAGQRGLFADDMNYGAEQERRGAPSPVDIPINGNLRTGLAALKSAVNHYFGFLDAWPDPDIIPPNVGNAELNWAEEQPFAEERERRNRPPGPNGGDYPRWDNINDNRKRVLVLINELLLPSVRFLHPNCIKALVGFNQEQQYQNNVIEQLNAMNEGDGQGQQPRIRMSTYEWQHCPVAFPGIRRYVGAGERRGATDRPNAIYLDDNYYPKQIWAYCLTGNHFNNYGPVGFQLDHLLAHKDSLIAHNFLIPPPNGDPLVYSGLFTSAANTVYTDRSLSSFTNHCPLAIEILSRIAQRIYNGEHADVCQMLPPRWNFAHPEADVDQVVQTFFAQPEWQQRHLVGDPIHVPAFAQWRLQRYDILLGAHP